MAAKSYRTAFNGRCSAIGQVFLIRLKIESAVSKWSSPSTGNLRRADLSLVGPATG
jgi:hypothetical protein